MAMQQDPIHWRYLAFFWGLFFRPKFQEISPQYMAKHMVLTYLHFRILKFPLIMSVMVDFGGIISATKGPRYRWPVWAASSASAQIGEKTPAAVGIFSWPSRRFNVGCSPSKMGISSTNNGIFVIKHEHEMNFINKMRPGVSNVLTSCKFLTLSRVEQKSWKSSDTYHIMQSLEGFWIILGNQLDLTMGHLKAPNMTNIFVTGVSRFHVEIIRSMVSRLM